MTKKEIGAILKKARIASGKTQKEVAEIIGRNQQVIGHWETGYSQPDANTLFTLCDIYGTTVDNAFGFNKNTISIEELTFIKKYNELDLFGKETVNYILDKESIRTKDLQKKEDLISKLESNSNTMTGFVENSDIPARLINYYYRLASAGTGQIVFDMPPTKRVEIPNIPKYKKVDYAIGVNGNSMEPIFHDEDMLLIEMTEEIAYGDIGIFLVDGESYVKKLGTGELISLNPQYENIPLTGESKCMGRVVDKFGK